MARRKRTLWGVDIPPLGEPLGPKDIALIAQRRKEAQAALRKRIEEGVVIGHG
jgi:hypothetical protein